MSTVTQALELMKIAVPTMFGVTLIFMIATVALKKAFPYVEEEEAED
jgi:hypothetical protein